MYQNAEVHRQVQVVGESLDKAVDKAVYRADRQLRVVVQDGRLKDSAAAHHLLLVYAQVRHHLPYQAALRRAIGDDSVQPVHYTVLHSVCRLVGKGDGKYMPETIAELFG